MPSRHKPLAPAVLEADRTTLTALKLIPDYTPQNPAYSIDALIALEAALNEAELEVTRARRAYEVALFNRNKAGRAFHDGIVNARIAVKAQFGAEAPEIGMIGLKRPSDRKRPVRRARTPST